MPVSEDDVRRLAKLAHLELSDDEVTRGAADLEALLDYVARLSAIDASSAPSPAPDAAPPLRPDVPRPGLPREVLTRDAPAAAHGLFRVPRVISRDEPPA